MLAEILEERVADNRGRRVPRGVKRKMSGYKLRPRAPQPAIRVDFAAAIRIIGPGYSGTAVASNQLPS